MDDMYECMCVPTARRGMAGCLFDRTNHKNTTNKPTINQAADLAECFRQVPPVFFSRDFELADPAMFEALVVKATPNSQVGR